MYIREALRLGTSQRHVVQDCPALVENCHFPHSMRPLWSSLPGVDWKCQNARGMDVRPYVEAISDKAGSRQWDGWTGNGHIWVNT
jgi:hypothetical protein